MAAVAYISIGNSDDKLSQSEWHNFCVVTDLWISSYATRWGTKIHGQWASEPTSPWQNACWAIELPENIDSAESLKKWLRRIAGSFNQDSIAWAVAHETEFLNPEKL